MFINAVRTLRVHCVEGITANPDVCRHYVEYSIGTVTALNPVIGYDKSTELAAEAMKTGRGIMELVREKKILTEKQIAEVLDPGRDDGAGRAVMTGPRRTLVAQAATAVLVAAIWWTAPPEGLSVQAWRLFALFAGAIFSVVVRRAADPHGVGPGRRRRGAHAGCSSRPMRTPASATAPSSSSSSRFWWPARW